LLRSQLDGEDSEENAEEWNRHTWPTEAYREACEPAAKTQVDFNPIAATEFLSQINIASAHADGLEIPDPLSRPPLAALAFSVYR
jgi:hypothetical protein